jgi:hypothetical protein
MLHSVWLLESDLTLGEDFAATEVLRCQKINIYHGHSLKLHQERILQLHVEGHQNVEILEGKVGRWLFYSHSYVELVYEAIIVGVYSGVGHCWWCKTVFDVVSYWFHRAEIELGQLIRLIHVNKHGLQVVFRCKLYFWLFGI